jgi:alpha-ribazole phosphatase
MATTLYLVRHGETEGGETRRYKGSIDVPLSDKGMSQIRESSLFIREYLANSGSSGHLSYLRDIHGSESASPPNELQMKAIYCSSLSRARTSAEIIAGPFDLEPVLIPDLRERSFGLWEGMTFLEIKEQYPSEFTAWAENPLKYSPPGGENTLEVRDRVISSLSGILESHKGEHVVVVAHGGVNRIILCHILGIPLENIFRIEQDHAGVNIIEFWDKYPVIKLLNGGRI